MFGWAFTLYRIITSIVIAMIAGVLTNILEKKTMLPLQSSTFSFSAMPPASKQSSCCTTKYSAEEKPPFSLTSALHYGFITLFGDITKPLFWGLLIGAAITTAIPDDLSSWLEGYPWLGYLIVVTIAIPMYVCATASLPIAASLILAGVAPGAAFVFLSAGPATNTVTIGVVKKMLGARALIIYLFTIAVGSILFGIGMDMLFSAASIDIKTVIHTHEETSWYIVAGSIAMWVMMIYFLIKPYLKSKKAEHCNMD